MTDKRCLAYPWPGGALAGLPVTFTCSLIALLLLVPTPSRGVTSLAGVHWYSGDSAMLDSSVPLGERGWNVETIFYASDCDGNTSTDPNGVRGRGQRAKDHGLVNIIRIDYQNLRAVPVISSEYSAWATNFINCTKELSSVASLYEVGNEPNIEGSVTAAQYAAAFNYLWGRRGEMPAGSKLLAVHNSPFTDPGWMNQMSTRLNGTDGFAFHTGGARPTCQDPRVACSYGGWNFDGGFRYYRNIIDQIDSRFWSKPIYLTEFNTYTGSPGSEPQSNYPTDWINKAFEELRGYNATRGSKPQVVAMCWFVDQDLGGWGAWALRSLAAPRTDMGEEFKNPANRGGGTTTCPTASLALPTDRWRLVIWNNRTFTGSPVERRYDAPGSGGFNFNWGSGKASGCTGNDNFSIRFTRSAYFPTTGTYTFTTTTDDGVRLYLDGTLILDRWFDQAPTTYNVSRSVTAGWHTVRMDYYENGGGATAVLSWSGGGSGNNATVLEGQSSVPTSINPGQTKSVSVKVQNTGGTTWRAVDLYRLGANSTNNVTWSAWSCGGYSVSPNNARAYLCGDVAPGGTHTFTFNITAPSSGSTAVFSVRMVRDGVQWFGETQTWNIPISGGGTNPYPSCPCNRTDNYCQHPPSTSGCPMTSPGGYCDPNGDGSYSDGDWVRGYNEYQQYCG